MAGYRICRVDHRRKRRGGKGCGQAKEGGLNAIHWCSETRKRFPVLMLFVFSVALVTGEYVLQCDLSTSGLHIDLRIFRRLSFFVFVEFLNIHGVVTTIHAIEYCQ